MNASIYAEADRVYDAIVKQMPKKQDLQMTYEDIYKELKRAGLTTHYPGKPKKPKMPKWKPEPSPTLRTV